MAKPNKWATETIIKEFKKIHGNKDDFSEVIYVKYDEKVKVKCFLHGEYWITPKNYLKGHRCPKCAIESLKEARLKNKVDVIKSANKVHNNVYDYSLLPDKVYLTNEYTIICPIHGEFKQRLDLHLNGHKCPKCSHAYHYFTSEIIEKFREVHGNKYDYSKVKYKNFHTQVCIICREKDENGIEHGEFWQTPARHLNGRGCRKCARNQILTTEEFIAKANKVHGSKYIYTKTNYERSNKKICVTCPIHGDFFVTPNNHLRGKGCPICKESGMERHITNILNNLDIKYIVHNPWNEWLRMKKPMTVDFYLIDYNLAIECQGEQHFRKVEYFGGEKKFKENQIRDKLKYDLCKEHNINIIYFCKNFENINEIISAFPYYKDKLFHIDDARNIIQNIINKK